MSIGEGKPSESKDPAVDSRASQRTVEDETVNEKQDEEKNSEDSVEEVTPIEENHGDIVTRDFYFLPIPRNMWHDPSKPPRFGLALNALFGLSSTFSELYVGF